MEIRVIPDKVCGESLGFFFFLTLSGAALLEEKIWRAIFFEFCVWLVRLVGL